MTARQKTILGYVIALMSLAGTVAATARWTYVKTVVEPLSLKLDAVRFAIDSVNRDHSASELRDMTLDVLCSKNVDPSNRRCK